MNRATIAGKRGDWLLDVIVGGTPYRFATRPLEVTTEAGDVLVYREGLDDLEESIAFDGAVDQSVAITLDATEAWGELVDRFLAVERAPATLRRWFEDLTFEQARVLIEGRVDGFSYGDRAEPVSFRVLRQVRSQSRRLPTPGMVVDTTTWPVRGGYSTPDRLNGAFYPIVIGCPGTNNSAGNPLPATEGLLVEVSGGATDDRLLVAGHRVLASQVWLFDFTDGTSPAATALGVSQTQDGVGRVVSYCDLTGYGGTVDGGREFYIGWDLTAGGGLISPITGGLLRGGGDIIEWAIRTFADLPLDSARFAGARPRLNAYLFDTYVNDPVDVLDWLQSEILPVLPVEPRQAEEGLFFYLRRHDATPEEAIARLDADAHQIQRESDVETRSEQVVNEVTVSYGPNRQSGRFYFRVVVGAAEVERRTFGDELQAGMAETDPRFVPSYRATLSQALYGRQPIDIELNSVWHTGTAIRHAQDIIAAQALPRRYVTYSAQTELEGLDIGDVVVVNDTAVGLLDVVALIVDVIVGGPEVLLEFELLDDPILLNRSTT